MLGTIVSIIIAALLLVLSSQREILIDWNAWAIVMVASSLFFLLILFLMQNSFLSSLQKAENNFTPRVITLFHQDRYLKLIKRWFYLFPLITFGLSLLLFFFDARYKLYIFACWIILLGISTDFISHIVKRTLVYLNPFSVVQMFGQAAHTSIRNGREGDLCDWIDALSETALKAIQRLNSSLCNEALNELQLITKSYLHASKSIGHPTENGDLKKMSISDQVSFTLSYLFERLQLINEKALEKRLAISCSKVVTTLGKIAVHAAKADISLASYPIYFLGACAKQGQEKGMANIAQIATATLLEVAKTIPQEIDVTYLELKDPYLTLITQMHELATESFKQDKNISISNLKQPFKELQAIFNADNLAKHQDTPVILDAINQVLAEFDTLELVLRTIPPLNITEEEPSP